MLLRKKRLRVQDRGLNSELNREQYKEIALCLN
jgi:hypothetical protein